MDEQSAAPATGALQNDMRLAIELEIPSDVRYIERIVDLVTRQCADFSYAPRVCRLNVPVALSEALSNAILRGNQRDASKHVRLRASVDREQLVVDVIDEGPGFDMDACGADPTLPENLDREDGRGIFLMRSLMDRVEHFQDDGNVVRLTLRRA